MIKFPDYSKATNAAYETLIEYKEFAFPIGIFHLFRNLNNLRLYTYDQLMARFGISSENFFPSSDYGYNICDPVKRRYIVAYNSKKDETTVRFTLAHELGHVILGHTEDGDKQNKEANCFARNLLCPIPAVEGFKVMTPDDYQQIFYVSEPMADVAKRLACNDRYYITPKNYSNYNDHVICNIYGISMAELYGLPKEYNELFA